MNGMSSKAHNNHQGHENLYFGGSIRRCLVPYPNLFKNGTRLSFIELKYDGCRREVVKFYLALSRIIQSPNEIFIKFETPTSHLLNIRSQVDITLAPKITRRIC